MGGEGNENETRLISWGGRTWSGRKKPLGAPGAGTSPENIIGREVEKRLTRPYCRSRQEESCRRLPFPNAHGAASNQKKGRSANGSQAGAAEHSGFLPQHGTKGTAQYYDLSGQRREADGSYPIVRQVLGGPRNQQPGAAHLQACDFDSRHRARSPQPHGS